jgi:transcriptional regulator with XRE-family HTH domain
MEGDNSDSQSKLWFPARLRELRVAAGKKQREVAAAVGMAESSYANAESANHKRIRLGKVHKLAKFYGLDDAATLELVAGWEALPESQYNRNMAKPWADRNARRAKLKNYDKLKDAAIGMFAMFVAALDMHGHDPGELCSCGGPQEGDMFAETEDSSGLSCDLCGPLKLFGLAGWTNLEDVTSKLAALQEELTG